MQTKKCNHHAHGGKRTLSINDFHKDKHASDGLKSMCKFCSRRKAKNYLKQMYADPKKRKEYNRRANEYWKNKMSQEQKMLAGAKDRARATNIPFFLVLEDIIIPKVCPILGILLVPKRGLSKKDKLIVGGRFNSPSIDRIDNTKGYTKDNVQIISWRANHLKNTATLDELILLGEHAKRLKKTTQ